MKDQQWFSLITFNLVAGRGRTSIVCTDYKQKVDDSQVYLVFNVTSPEMILNPVGLPCTCIICCRVSTHPVGAGTRSVAKLARRCG